jgi:hypothetical protein
MVKIKLDNSWMAENGPLQRINELMGASNQLQKAKFGLNQAWLDLRLTDHGATLYPAIRPVHRARSKIPVILSK